MLISDISVRRPVLAAVISLVLLILGLLAGSTLSVREYPDVQPPVVSIDTRYTGASGDVIERRITQVLEDEVAGLEGMVKMTSRSQDERSSITMEFDLDRDIDGAANDVRERVSRVLRALPQEADPPQITKQDNMMDATMYVDVSSDTRSVMDVTDYAERNLVDRLGVVDGVASVRLSGGRRPAMRVWLDRDALAARGLTVQDVENTLRRENVELPAGRIESVDREFTLRAVTRLDTPEDFGALVIGRGASGRFVRLNEVADVRLEPEDTRSIARSNKQAGVSLGIVPQAQANIVAVNQAVIDEVDRLQSTLPDDINMDVNVDFSEFVGKSMIEVIKALFIALGVVLMVMLLFLNSWRATIIPGLTIPVSIIAAAMVMAVLGYTINTLTLLAAVLAIGLVVDDAVVVLENIVRHREQGSPPLLAAIDGSRQIGFAVIATTVVLVSVFLPVALAPGRIGVLFGEFGIALASAVVFSSLVALTLVPMMCSRMMRSQAQVTSSERGRKRGQAFRALAGAYRSGMTRALRAPWMALVLVALVSAGGWYLFEQLPQEYAPLEDRGMMIVMVQGPEGASFDYMDDQISQIEDIAIRQVEAGEARRTIIRTGGWGAGSDITAAFMYMPLESHDERRFTAMEIAGQMRGPMAELPGVRAMVFLPPSLNMGGGRELQVVLRGNEYEQIAQWRDRVLDRVRENPQILGMTSDYYEAQPQIKVGVDRARAADLG
ncbi:MAG: efflux RND transporter permease subunit, partial [Gammaproteobacteria bacterium]|nr:efflux RND transporter permease subunit [Gammaproteobacteria bacterium]